MTLETSATDSGYGYSSDKSVSVGGGLGEGGHNTYRFLNALTGPEGQQVHYSRVGTCCAFKTDNAADGEEGLLEVYEVLYDDVESVWMYFNWYESGEVLIPTGFSSLTRKP